MTMFIGRSYADAIRPSSVAELQRAHENGAHIVLVDPRCNNSIAFADEWVPINPVPTWPSCWPCRTCW